MAFTSKSYSCGSLGRVRKLLNLNHGNWVNVPVPQAASLTLLDIETDPNNGDNVFTVGEADVVNPTNFYGIAVSNNGGTTWNIPGGNYQSAVLSNTNMGLTFQWNEIIVVNSTLSFVVGSVNLITRFATIAMSTDGGATYNLVNWHTNCTPNPTTAGLSQMDAFSVHFANANIGVVGLHNFVIKTTDGGGTWIIMNGGTALSTAVFPNPPGTLLPIGNITGIHIKADESHIIGIGTEFIVSTTPVTNPNPAGVLIDSWQNNFITSNSPGSAPIYSGFTTNLPIGWHLGGMQSPNDNVIWASGDSKLGIHSTDHGYLGWVVPPAPGWDTTGGGPSRRAAHYYKYDSSNSLLEGLYNLSDATGNTVYWNSIGFNPPAQVLSDDFAGGLNYAPTAIWTWYQETPNPICYTLTDCANGNTVHTTVNLSAYLNKVIQVSEFPGHCFLVSEGCSQPNTPQTVTYVADFVDCATCAPPQNPCACPPGTTLVTLPDGSQACREDIVVRASGPSAGFCQKNAQSVTATSGGTWGQSNQYCRYGAAFHGETSGLSWPITFSTACTPGSQLWKDFSLNTVPVVSTTSNSLWGTGTTTDGRFNVAGVRIDPNSPCPTVPINGKYGFTYCLTVATPTTYCFGFGGLEPQILINGAAWIDSVSANQDVYLYENWNVFQLTLPAGTYIIQMAARPQGGLDTCGNFTFNNPPFTPRTPGGEVGMAFEIYQATAAALSAMTSLPPGVLVYSTLNEVGKPMDYGTAVYNYRCPCDPPPAICPSSFGNYNVINPVLDNCTVNPLNPNADPAIYVCHTYKYTAISGCCYLLTDCENPSITYITSTDLSTYLNKVIKVSEYQGCFTVSQTDCPQGVPAPPPVTLVSSYNDCPSCLPKCYTLTDCKGLVASILTNTDLSLYVGGVINITGSDVCWQVSLAQGCQGSIAVTVSNSFVDCATCSPTCYTLVNCQDSNDTIITNTDLSAVLGQVIYIDGCPGKCWQIFLSDTCDGAVSVVLDQTFADCATCLNIPPPAPVELRPRMVKPGYTTPGCDPAYTERVSCSFANAAYDNMVINRYGVTMCCNEPIEKWDIKMQLLQLRAIYDPDLCKCAFEKCCPPCAVVATITVFNPTPVCQPPTNVVATLNIPVPVCPPPTNVQAGIVISGPPCVCYMITLTKGAVCTFDYVDCNGIAKSDTLVSPSITYICSQTLPTTNCAPGLYVIQSTPGDCALGTCGAP